MSSVDDRPRSGSVAPTRRRFLQATALLGAGIALAGPAQIADGTDLSGATASCGESLSFILNLAYAAEHCAMTLYYTALTSPALLYNPKLAGASGNLEAVAPDGNAQNCANLQAALDQERIHANILAGIGATSPYGHFFFPASAFQNVGYTSEVGSFLWLLDRLETAVIAGYLTAIRNLGTLGRPDIAAMCARNLAVECEHRALYRMIAEDDPADNMTVPVAEFPCLSDAVVFFEPYLTGRGFPSGVVATPAFPIPTTAQVARVVGRHRAAS